MRAIPRYHRHYHLPRKQSHHSDARICFHNEIGSIAGVYWEFVGNPYGIMSIIFGSIVSLIAFVAVVCIERAMGKPPAPPAIPDDVKEI